MNPHPRKPENSDSDPFGFSTQITRRHFIQRTAAASVGTVFAVSIFDALGEEQQPVAWCVTSITYTFNSADYQPVGLNTSGHATLQALYDYVENRAKDDNKLNPKPWTVTKTKESYNPETHHTEPDDSAPRFTSDPQLSSGQANDGTWYGSIANPPGIISFTVKKDKVVEGPSA